MKYHITINGYPLCQHTGRLAGMEDRARVVGQPTCGQGSERGAMEGAKAWKRAHPYHAVGVMLGDCPAAAEAAA